MERKVTAMATLAVHGLVERGTVIELIPSVRPPSAPNLDGRIFLATIENPAGLQGSVRWHLDNQLYSLSELTRVLQARYGATPNVGLFFDNWRRVGTTETLWAEAERFPR
jgi:hypothetical protein